MATIAQQKQQRAALVKALAAAIDEKLKTEKGTPVTAKTFLPLAEQFVAEAFQLGVQWMTKKASQK